MSLPVYSEYKNSGVELLGNIPSHWDCMAVKFSLSIPITDGPHETPEKLDEGIPFISAEAVKGNRLDFSRKWGYISATDNLRYSKKYKPQMGDVYMVKSGATTGNIAKVETDEEFNIWSPLAVLRPDNERSTSGFLYYYMQSKPFRHSVELSWSFGTQQNIGMGVISNLIISSPPTDEQQGIADYLDIKTGQIDSLIKKKRELIERLKEQRTAVITHAVTKGLNDSVPMKNSGVEWLGEVPEHWERATKIKYISSLKGRLGWQGLKADEYTNEGPYVVSSAHFKHHNIDWKLCPHVTPERYKMDVNIQLADEDILLMKDGAALGKLAYIDELPKEACLNSHLLLFRPEKVDGLKAYHPKHMFYYMQTGFFQDYILVNGKGSTFLGVSQESIGNHKVCLPPINEQIKIADFLDINVRSFNKLIKKAEEAIQRLEEYRTAIITAAVTGKVKVG